MYKFDIARKIEEIHIIKISEFRRYTRFMTTCSPPPRQRHRFRHPPSSSRSQLTETCTLYTCVMWLWFCYNVHYHKQPYALGIPNPCELYRIHRSSSFSPLPHLEKNRTNRFFFRFLYHLLWCRLVIHSKFQTYGICTISEYSTL